MHFAKVHHIELNIVPLGTEQLIVLGFKNLFKLGLRAIVVLLRVRNHSAAKPPHVWREQLNRPLQHPLFPENQSGRAAIRVSIGLSAVVFAFFVRFSIEAHGECRHIGFAEFSFNDFVV